jgi:hypothetical protein
VINKIVEKDERTVFVENAGNSFGYKFISYALLLDVIYRSIRFNEAAWDLLAIVVVSGVLITIYQYKQKTLVKNWVKITLIASAITAVIAFFITIIFSKLWK